MSVGELKKMELSDCERMILGCVYEYHRKNSDLPNLKDIMFLVERKYGIQWKMQTLCTFLTRMEKKGVITSERRGRYSHYYPVVPYETYVRSEFMELCNIYFENSEKKLKQFVRQM